MFQGHFLKYVTLARAPRVLTLEAKLSWQDVQDTGWPEEEEGQEHHTGTTGLKSQGMAPYFEKLSHHYGQDMR